MEPLTETCKHLAPYPPLSDQDLERVHSNWNHWQSNAEQFGSDHAASWGDKYAIELEIGNLLKHLAAGGRWLDAGCANGYTTFRVLAGRPQEVQAFDFSPLMIEQACKAQPHCDPQGLIHFEQGNVLNISQRAESVDQAYTVRVLINLPSWDAQQQAIREVHRVLKPGGRYILSEAFLGSLTKLNRLREVAELAPLCVPAFNHYLEEQRLECFLPELFEIECVERFTSPYYVASRLLRELVVEPHSSPDYDHPVNAVVSAMSPASQGGDFGVQKAYILRKLT